MFGVINLNKPAHWTSREGVSAVKRSLRDVKVGHAGTLDPLATGVLPICLGAATRLVEYAHRLPKSYRTTFLLGRRSDSDDVESDVEELVDPPVPSESDVCTALAGFTGNIEQRPPRHSAVKVDGRRAYHLARRGREFETTTRTVAVHRLAIVEYQYPQLVLDVDCGTGTYVRSLGRDIAESLGTAAVMAALVRTAVGPLTLAQAVTPAELDRDFAAALLPATVFTGMLPTTQVTAAEVQELILGRPVRLADRPIESPQIVTGVPTGRVEIAAIVENGNLAAILAELYPALWFPVRNFSQPA